MGSALRCPVCRKELEPSPCLRCLGAGTTKFLLVLNVTCTTCGGSGIQERCPDLPLHINQGPPVGPPQADSTICHTCNGGGFIAYDYGSGGGARRCATCDGAGLIPHPR